MKSFNKIACILFLGISFSCSDDTVEEMEVVQCEGSPSTFTINLTTAGCTETPSFTHSFSEEIDQANDLRIISANSIPNHLIGRFPNSGNPHTVSSRPNTYEIDLTPQLAPSPTSGEGSSVGILFSGVELDPFTAEFFQASDGSFNMNWNFNALTNTLNLGTDCNNAHVQPSGKYHYHGTPSAFLEDLGADGTQMIKVGYASDGFPIYYKFGFNASGQIVELESGYQLRTEERGGDGISAPDGCPDGTYFQDYEFVKGISELDECNGRFGRTPESDNEYYYVITDNFPSLPLCLSGTPSDDFRI